MTPGDPPRKRNGAIMGSESRTHDRRRSDLDESEDLEQSSRHPRIDPGERDEYEEWRRERGDRGRKRRDKAGGRHRHRAEED